MAVSQEFLDFVLEQLSGWDKVVSRRMFGGVGLYCKGMMFGLIADDVAYLKVDDSKRGDFEKKGCKAFQPFPEKAISMPYYEIPVEVLEDRIALIQWCDKAFGAAKRKKFKKGKVNRTPE